MIRTIVILIVFLFTAATLAQVKTGKKYITGIVDPVKGLITVRSYPGTGTDPIYTFPEKSFIGVMINGKVFTNNKTGQNISSDTRFGGFLDNGVTAKVGDTIRTSWVKSGCTILQEVYPVLLEASEQIVMRWKVRNNLSAAVTCQNQILLDLQIASQKPNEGTGVLTRYGYGPKWEQYTPESSHGIPWFFYAPEFQLPNAPSFQTGYAGTGYTRDGNYKLGLKPPSYMAIGDWGNPIGTAAMVDNLWGVSSKVNWGTAFADGAVLLQWNAIEIGPGQTVELGSTSYGSSEFETCEGQLFGVVAAPQRFTWAGAKYMPDTASIEFYAFNSYTGPSSTGHPPSVNTMLRLDVDPGLKILSNAWQQTDPSTIQPYTCGVATWKVVANKYVDCRADRLSMLKFTGKSSLDSIGPIFSNSGRGDTCGHTVAVDCSIIDSLPPVIENVDTTTHRKRSFDTRDDRIADRGIDRILWQGIPLPGKQFDAFNFIITGLNAHEECDLAKLHLSVTQRDSTIGGCIRFTIVDCGKNESYITVCLPDSANTPVPDIIPPVITLDSTVGRFLIINVSENETIDSGVDSVWAVPGPGTDVSNFTFKPVGILDPCERVVKYNLTQLDTTSDGCFTIYARDCAGNSSPQLNYCFKESVKDVGKSVGESFTILGNPATSESTLRISLSTPAKVSLQLISIEGQVMCKQHPGTLAAGSTDIPLDLSVLSTGTYYLLIDCADRQYTQKLQVVK